MPTITATPAEQQVRSGWSQISIITLLLLGLFALQIAVMIILATPTIAMPGAAKESEKSHVVKDNRNATTARVLKCCPFGGTFDERYKCNAANDTRELTKVPKRVTKKDGTEKHYEKNELELTDAQMTCIDENEMHTLNPAANEGDDFRVSAAGTLQLETDREEYYPPGRFCLEYFNSTAIIAIACYAKNNTVFYEIGLYLSVVFMACTFLVYALIRELRNLQGKSLMCQLATLTMAYVGLLVAIEKTEKHDTLCIVIAYFIQFSFLAYFYWLNVMCFDLWWIFSGQRKFGKNSKQLESNKFKIYSIYAWGCSTIILLFACFSHVFPALSGSLSPKVGEGGIFWFSENNEDFSKVYFFGPIITLIICNLLMFAHTTIILLQQLRHRDKMTSCAESRRNNKKETRRFVLFLKLFLVMGVSWLGESLQWFYEKEIENLNYAVAVYATDAVQLLRGPLIFLMFVCRREIFILINRKLNPKTEFNRRSTFTTSTSSSQHHSNSLKVIANRRNSNQI